MRTKTKWMLLLSAVAGLFFLQRWGSWRLLEYGPLAARASRIAWSFPETPGACPALEGRRLQPGNATETYLQAAEMAKEDAVSALDRIRRAWLRNRDVSPSQNSLPDMDWSSFRCPQDHPGLALLRAGSHQEDAIFPADLVSPLPPPREFILGWTYLLRGAVAQLDGTRGEDPAAWEDFTLDLLQVTEHFRSAPKGSHIYWIGLVFQAKLSRMYGEALDGEKAERMSLHSEKLEEALLKATQGSSAVRDNRVAQLRLAASDEPVCWRWSEGILPLVVESRIEQAAQGFFWRWRTKEALKRVRQEEILREFWGEEWDADDLFESSDLMSAPFLEGRPFRSWERWQMERFIRLRDG